MFRLVPRSKWLGFIPPRREVFARKVIRVFGVITEEMLLLQIRAINMLNAADHKNILKVLNNGWIPDSSFYFFDMEFCLSSLDSVIHRTGETHFTTMVRPGANNGDFFARFKFTLQIACQIIAGLVFIHRHGEVHRNLKPSNGMLRDLNGLLISSFAFEGWFLE